MTFGEILKQRWKPIIHIFMMFLILLHVFSDSYSDEFIIYTKNLPEVGQIDYSTIMYFSLFRP